MSKNNESHLQIPWTGVGLVLFLFAIHLINFFSKGFLDQIFSNTFHLTATGQLWRLFTAQLIHLDSFHLFEDCISIAVIWWLLCRDFQFYEWRMLICFFAGGTLGQLLALAAWKLGLTDYQSLVGSSDALHGLIYLYMQAHITHSNRLKIKLLWIMGMLILFVSVIYTCVTGTMIYSSKLLSAGYNHFGGIIVYMLAFYAGYLKANLKVTDE